jgi:hypothetical protein
MRTNITANACVTALEHAAFSQKRITHIQVAVGLAIFMLEGGASEKAKDALVAVYARAGMDCGSYTGSEYNTVRRKVGAASILFKTLGAEKIATWVGEEKNGRAISAIATQLGEMKLDSIERVLAHCGAAPTIRSKEKVVPINGTNAPSAEHKPTDRQAYLFELESPHVRIHVDEAATNEELRDAVSKLQKLIRSRNTEKQAA